MNLQELLVNVFEFVATALWLFFWCVAAGVGCFVVYGVLKTLRQYFEDKHEAELLEAWCRRNQMIAAAAHDLDHPDELQRELAEYYITQRLP